MFCNNIEYQTHPYSEEILGSMQRQLEITESRFPGWNNQDPKIKQQVAIAKAKAAALEIEKKNRIQAAANQAMVSGGGAVVDKAHSLTRKFPNLQKPVPAEKPMSDAMQVLILLRFNSLSTFHNPGSHGGDNRSPTLCHQQGHLGNL